jgi:hypothetical protein
VNRQLHYRPGRSPRGIAFEVAAREAGAVVVIAFRPAGLLLPRLRSRRRGRLPGVGHFALTTSQRLLNANRVVRGDGYVFLNVDNADPQDDSNTCGANSAARLLRYYGINMSFARAKAEVSQVLGILGGFGSTPSQVYDFLHRYKPDSGVESGTSFQRIKDLLWSGKPVMALISPDVGQLHYVVLRGFNERTQTIFYNDTNGATVGVSYAEFQRQWNWDFELTPLAKLGVTVGLDLLFPGLGGLFGLFGHPEDITLSALGVHRQTILY